MFTQSLIYSSRNNPDTPNAGAMAYKGNVIAVALFNSKCQITVKQIWQSVTVHQLSSSNTRCSCMNKSLITIWHTAASNLFAIQPPKKCTGLQGSTAYTKNLEWETAMGVDYTGKFFCSACRCSVRSLPRLWKTCSQVHKQWAVRNLWPLTIG